MGKDSIRYAIWATRSSQSIMGPAGAWCKHDDKIEMFDREEDAIMVADRYNTECKSTNVKYEVKIYI